MSKGRRMSDLRHRDRLSAARPRPQIRVGLFNLVLVLALAGVGLSTSAHPTARPALDEASVAHPITQADRVARAHNPATATTFAAASNTTFTSIWPAPVRALVQEPATITTGASRSMTVSGIYGSALAMDAKNNYQVGWIAGQRVSHRFRAGTTAALTKIAFNQRGGSGYSAGTGGVMKITIQTDRDGKPSGTVLASLSFSPGNPSGGWEKQTAHTFGSPARLTKGRKYHVVFANVDSLPKSNYISVNEAYQYLATDPRQPAFKDVFAVMTNRGSGWAVMKRDTPVMDLTYANGHHDGNAYGSIVPDYYSVISGSSKMVRERFKVRGSDRTVRSATVRVKRIKGNGSLRIRLKRSSGKLLATGTTSASQIPLSSLPKPIDGSHWDESSLAGGRWVTVRFANPVTLRAGATYNLRLSTNGRTKYVAISLREQDGAGAEWGSRAFRDGAIQRTTDGSTWKPVYAWAALDLQFFLR